MTICSHCGANNRNGAAFCRNCGRLLLAACPRCHAAAAPDANFCDACGGPLSPRAWTGTVTGDGWDEGRDDGRGTTDDHREKATPGYEGARAQIDDGPTGRPFSPSPSLPLPPAPDPAFPLDRYIPRELLAKVTAAHGAAAERRVVTLLFCDLKGSTAFAEQLDPEEWTEIVNGAFEVMVRPIYKYEGTVARLMGDGLLAFFGAPIAHEDDPRRAVLAGL
nr:zinc ribbon domain-containing protein [Promineifilum sp.]